MASLPSPPNPLNSLVDSTTSSLDIYSCNSSSLIHSPIMRNPNISIEPVTSQTLPSYRRLISLLLPIRYPDAFYKESIAASPERLSLSLVALWHDTPQISSNTCSPPKVVAGIQARLEPFSSNITDPKSAQNLYIQTLALLAPYRQLGIASSLLAELLSRALHQHTGTKIESVYAHVWEASADALEWYVKRGFEVENGVIPGYYRRLKPGGARIVRKRLGVADYFVGTGDTVVSGREERLDEDGGGPKGDEAIDAESNRG